MGECLVTYIVKGPKSLDSFRIQAAHDYAKYFARVMATYADLGAAAVKQLLLDDEATAVTRPDARSDFGWVTGASIILHSGNTLEELSMYELPDIEELVATWNDPASYPDVNFREDPDDPNQLILVTGDTSWGDTPQNPSFVLLEAALCTGVAEVLGLR